ncbi:MAG: tRNA pseudouridine(38-40) synthase TruA [Deltaproteobacteria bacterium]|nr:tRNA pseudouridine(38-40) synthase TruA [Deltaproteobacteria bacterium]
MSTTRNILLFLEFDGTAYAGWQLQADRATVQGELEDAIRNLTGSESRVYGCSRTDAGVHAYDYAALFKTESKIPIVGIIGGLNSLLPEDIAVKDAKEVDGAFDPRKSAKNKTYLYRIFNAPYRTPLFRHRAWSVFHTLDIEVMQKGAAMLVGKKDFASFMAADSDAEHSVREILSFDVRRAEGSFIELEVKGTAFLRHMVRIMAGTLVTLGRGKITLGELTFIIDAKDRTKAPMTAPPEGLFLKKVEY